MEDMSFFSRPYCEMMECDSLCDYFNLADYEYTCRSCAQIMGYKKDSLIEIVSPKTVEQVLNLFRFNIEESEKFLDIRFNGILPKSLESMLYKNKRAFADLCEELIEKWSADSGWEISKIYEKAKDALIGFREDCTYSEFAKVDYRKERRNYLRRDAQTSLPSQSNLHSYSPQKNENSFEKYDDQIYWTSPIFSYSSTLLEDILKNNTEFQKLLKERESQEGNIQRLKMQKQRNQQKVLELSEQIEKDSETISQLSERLRSYDQKIKSFLKTLDAVQINREPFKLDEYFDTMYSYN